MTRNETTTMISSQSHFLEDRMKKISELSEALVQRVLPREIISGDDIEDEQLAEENYVKCVEFCRANCRLAASTSNASKEQVKRECVDILDRFSREAQMSKRYSLTVLFDALEREYGRNRRKFTYKDEDDEEFWSRVALFLLRTAGKPMKTEYEASTSSVLKSLEEEEEERREQRKERNERDEHASTIDERIRLAATKTTPRMSSLHEKSKQKNERGESLSDSSLSEWSDTDNDEEDLERRRKGGGSSTPKQTKMEAEKDAENIRNDDNASSFSLESLSSDSDEEVSFSDDDIEEEEGDGYSIRTRDEDEENANEEDPGFSWRSIPGGTDDESLDARGFHGSDGISNKLSTSSTSQENPRKISRASFAQMERAQRMLRKLRNNVTNKDNDDVLFFSSRLVERVRTSKYTSTIGESLVVSRILNAISAGGVANFDIESMEIPHVSKNALTNVLKSSKQIMDVFEDIGRVKERLKNLSNLFAVDGKQSPTVHAFVNALMKIKAEIQYGFDELFEATRRASVRADAFSAPTLLRLSIESRKLARKALCLQRIAEMCSPGPKSSVGKFAHPATASATILSILYNLMNEYNELSGSLDEFSIIFRCFLSSSTSYLNAVDVWIHYGILTSPEIFIDSKKSTRWREGWYLREDKDVPVFFKSVAEDVLNAGIHREFSRMIFAGEGDDDVQNQAGKKLTFVSKMISELKALLLLRASTDNNDENIFNDNNSAASKETLRKSESIENGQESKQSQGDDIDAAFSTEDPLLSDLRSVVSLTNAQSRKSPSKKTSKTSFSECYDFVKWVSKYFANDASTVLGIPVNTLVSRSMLHQIRLAAMSASDHALEKLKSSYGVKAELTKLRALFLGGCGEVALDFFNHIFEEFESIRRLREEESDEIGGLVRFDTNRLTEVLRDAILEHTNENTFGSRESLGERIDEVRVQVFYSRPSPDDDDEYKGCEELQALTDLNILYHKKKIHAASRANSNAIVASIICDAVSLSKYNEVFKYLMQLRFAQRSLDYGVLSQWTSENRRKKEPSPSSSEKTLSMSSSLEIELKHFVMTLRTFVTTKILSVEWNHLLESIDDSAQSVDDVKLAHEVYLDNISRVSLASPDSTWSLLSTHIKTILAIAAEFGNMRQKEVKEEASDVGVKLRELALRRMEKKFSVARANVLKILKNLDAGSDDEAESLYEQLNFNNYYSS